MASIPPDDHSPIDRLTAIMAALRSPDGGCPWDLEQSLSTLTPHLIEEAYEVLEAVESGNRTALKEELGDILLQVVFQSQLCAEEGAFAFTDVVEGLIDKLVRRHPHVFGESDAGDADAVLKQWDAIKQAEKVKAEEPAALLGKVPESMPALSRAYEIQKRASRQGFDWDHVDPVRAKVDEEWRELSEAIAAGDTAAIEEEMGDLLFALVNVARHVKCRPEDALRSAIRKFVGRVEQVDERVRGEGRTLADCSEQELIDAWERVKGAR